MVLALALEYERGEEGGVFPLNSAFVKIGMCWRSLTYVIMEKRFGEGNRGRVEGEKRGGSDGRSGALPCWAGASYPRVLPCLASPGPAVLLALSHLPFLAFLSRQPFWPLEASSSWPPSAGSSSGS